jgi:hypothetical protein
METFDMKQLELYLNKNGDHKFVAAQGSRRDQVCSAAGDNNALLSQALKLIEADSDFERQVRIFDTNGIMLRGMTTKYVTVDQLRDWNSNASQ